MIVKVKVILNREINLITAYRETHFAKGVAEIPADLARMAFRRKWAVPYKPSPEHKESRN